MPEPKNNYECADSRENSEIHGKSVLAQGIITKRAISEHFWFPDFAQDKMTAYSNFKRLAQVFLTFYSNSNLKALCTSQGANNVCLTRTYQCLERILTHHAINLFWLNIVKSCFVPNVLWIGVFLDPFLNQVSSVQSLSSFIRILWISVISRHKLLTTTSKYNFETIPVRIINKLAS